MEEFPLALVMLVVFKDSFVFQGIQGVYRSVHVPVIQVVKRRVLRYVLRLAGGDSTCARLLLFLSAAIALVCPNENTRTISLKEASIFPMVEFCCFLIVTERSGKMKEELWTCWEAKVLH